MVLQPPPRARAKCLRCVWAVYYKQIRKSEQIPPLHLRAADLAHSPGPRSACGCQLLSTKLVAQLATCGAAIMVITATRSAQSHRRNERLLQQGTGWYQPRRLALDQGELRRLCRRARLLAAMRHPQGLLTHTRRLAMLLVAALPVLASPADGPAAANCHQDPGLHGENHPPVFVGFASEPLARSGRGRMELRFSVLGAVPGFRYRIMADNVRGQRVVQQQELVFGVSHEHSWYDARMEFHIPASSKRGTQGWEESYRFAVSVVDMCATLTGEDTLVARKEGTFRLPSESASHAAPEIPPEASASPLRASSRHGQDHPGLTVHEPEFVTGDRDGWLEVRFTVVGFVPGFRSGSAEHCVSFIGSLSVTMHRGARLRARFPHLAFARADIA